jgi:hypothetical protein
VLGPAEKGLARRGDSTGPVGPAKPRPGSNDAGSRSSLPPAGLSRPGSRYETPKEVIDQRPRRITRGKPRGALLRQRSLGRRSWDPLPLVRLVQPRPKKTGSSSSGCGCPTGCSPRSRWRRWAASANASGGTPAMSPTPEPPAPLDPHRGRLPDLAGLVVPGGFPDGTGEGRVVVCDVSDDSAAAPSLEMTGA